MQPPNIQQIIAIGIIEHEGRFLVLHRIDEVPEWHNKWELPGGKIEPEETPIDALYREIKEETGLDVHDPKLLGIHTHHWRFPDVTKQIFLVVYRVQATTTDVKLDPDEDDTYKWVTVDEYLAMPDLLEANKNMIAELYAPMMKGEK